MSMESINTIRGVEESMDQARLEAKASAQKLLAEAEREGRALLENGKTQAAAESARMMGEAEQQAEKRRQEILAAAGVGVIAADVMRNEIQRQDTVLRKDVSAMRGMQSKMRVLAGQCAGTEIAEEVGRLSEALRYSDPVSSQAVAEIEAELESLIDELQRAAMDQDFPSARELCRKAA